MSRDYGYTDDPEYIAGLNLGFKWKDLSVNMQFTGAWNVSRYLSDVFMRRSRAVRRQTRAVCSNITSTTHGQWTILRRTPSIPV